MTSSDTGMLWGHSVSADSATGAPASAAALFKNFSGSVHLQNGFPLYLYIVVTNRHQFTSSTRAK
jgi:hypothetical protein